MKDHVRRLFLIGLQNSSPVVSIVSVVSVTNFMMLARALLWTTKMSMRYMIETDRHMTYHVKTINPTQTFGYEKSELALDLTHLTKAQKMDRVT
ncbi:hypothetical protein EVAR_2277_1 [Eumeta japonica]|uniref:Uncharacterized protein n=1 Tax=Eumeta variegata TaxID=151549 RepID=A0A4C1SFT2_EUMVA|nr:hypothetical protein EVAR_2277_1 [Eumeta japonica]